MTMTEFSVNSMTRSGYLALPDGGSGKGVLVLHAWWGLTEFFKQTADRLAANGFVAFAPDLHHGLTAETIEEAKHLMETRDEDAAQATAEGALNILQTHPAVQGEKFGAIGFSMGADHALLLDEANPDAFGGIVLFYGGTWADLSGRKTPFQLHFAENDDWEPLEDAKQMAGENAELHIYPDAYHWFFEENKPEHFKPEASELAWERLLGFLRKNL
jgi:carboxymethylenebutenolidase